MGLGGGIQSRTLVARGGQACRWPVPTKNTLGVGFNWEKPIMYLLPKKEVPNWLSNVNTNDDMKRVSAKEILEQSLYYPCSGRDGDPVKLLGGLIYSFVYADSGVSLNQVANSLKNPERNFKGYFVKSELCNHVCPNSVWVIMQRSQNLTKYHGPDRFSFLYVAGNDIETFQRLYISNETYPNVVALIKAGWMGSDNYDKNGELARNILENIYGFPCYMLECTSRPRNPENSFWGKHPYRIHRWKLDYDDIDLILWANTN
jgi:hypothetical protein